jgi:hypothetical protein
MSALEEARQRVRMSALEAMMQGVLAWRASGCTHLVAHVLGEELPRGREEARHVDQEELREPVRVVQRVVRRHWLDVEHPLHRCDLWERDALQVDDDGPLAEMAHGDAESLREPLVVPQRRRQVRTLPRKCRNTQAAQVLVQHRPPFTIGTKEAMRHHTVIGELGVGTVEHLACRQLRERSDRVTLSVLEVGS